MSSLHVKPRWLRALTAGALIVQTRGSPSRSTIARAGSWRRRIATVMVAVGPATVLATESANAAADATPGSVATAVLLLAAAGAALAGLLLVAALRLMLYVLDKFLTMIVRYLALIIGTAILSLILLSAGV